MDTSSLMKLGRKFRDDISAKSNLANFNCLYSNPLKDPLPLKILYTVLFVNISVFVHNIKLSQV